jgi:Lysine methyltransferase
MLPLSADTEPRVSTQELTWGEAQLPTWCRNGGYDWVLASDVCYDSERFQPLLDTVLQLVTLNSETKVGGFGIAGRVAKSRPFQSDQSAQATAGWDPMQPGALAQPH